MVMKTIGGKYKQKNENILIVNHFMEKVNLHFSFSMFMELLPIKRIDWNYKLLSVKEMFKLSAFLGECLRIHLT